MDWHGECHDHQNYEQTVQAQDTAHLPNSSNYDATHKKLLDTVADIKNQGGRLTVRNVAAHAGVCVATAYNHKCPEMIRQALGIEEDE